MSTTWPTNFSSMSGLNGSSTSLPYIATSFYHAQASNNSSHVAEFVRDTVKALYTYAVPTICVLGIIGDVTSFCIFVFTSFRYQPCSQYLAALTFVDALFLISQLISCLMMYVPALALAPGYCSVMVYLSYVCSFLSAWFVVLMMLERYLVVCHPFRSTLFSHKRKALVSVMVLVGLSACIYFHSFFSTTATESGGCSIRMSLYDFVVVFTYVDSFLAFLLPFSIILLCSLRIILKVRKFRRRHNLLHCTICGSQRYTVLSVAQVRSTKMLVWVSSVFVLLHLPSYAIRLYGMIVEQLQDSHNTDNEQQAMFPIAQHLCQMLYYVNFAVDFFVFSVTSSNFRRSVSRCFRCY